MGIYEESGLTIASQAVMENQDGESILLLEVVNNSDAVVGVSTTNIDINGLCVCDSTWFYDTINPGKPQLWTLICLRYSNRNTGVFTA